MSIGKEILKLAGRAVGETIKTVVDGAVAGQPKYEKEAKSKLLTPVLEELYNKYEKIGDSDKQAKLLDVIEMIKNSGSISSKRLDQLKHDLPGYVDQIVNDDGNDLIDALDKNNLSGWGGIMPSDERRLRERYYGHGSGVNINGVLGAIRDLSSKQGSGDGIVKKTINYLKDQVDKEKAQKESFEHHVKIHKAIIADMKENNPELVRGKSDVEIMDTPEYSKYFTKNGVDPSKHTIILGYGDIEGVKQKAEAIRKARGKREEKDKEKIEKKEVKKREALIAKRAEAILWEWFTTKERKRIEKEGGIADWPLFYRQNVQEAEEIAKKELGYDD